MKHRSEPALPAIDAKLAKALANPWRNRILMELHLRPASPQRFHEEFGGPSLSAIARYFRQLRDWGYLELADELRGGKRRGAVEKVYRAIQRVYLDTETWETLPRYLREECSAAVLGGLIRRIGTAVEAGTFDAETDRHLSWKAVLLDRMAWREYVERLDEVLAWVAELEAGSADRMTAFGAESMSVTVALLAFRSPPNLQPPSDTAQELAGNANSDASPPFLVTPQMAKALANPWRYRILMEAHMREISPREFDEEFEGPGLPATARYFRQLRDWGFLELRDERTGGKRRGAVEKAYCAVRRVHFDTGTWERLPEQLRVECSGSVLDGLILQIRQAVERGSFDAELDRHLSWKAISLDRRAWVECVMRFDELLAWVGTLEVESAERIEGTDEELIPAIVAHLAFRSPD